MTHLKNKSRCLLSRENALIESAEMYLTFLLKTEHVSNSSCTDILKFIAASKTEPKPEGQTVFFRFCMK